jgi:hypothetical protein
MSRVSARLALNFARLDALDRRRALVLAEIEADRKTFARERGVAFIRVEALRREIQSAQAIDDKPPLDLRSDAQQETSRG